MTDLHNTAPNATHRLSQEGSGSLPSGEAWEDRVRSTFDAIHVSEEVLEATRASISEQRRETAQPAPRQTSAFKVIRRVVAAAACVIAVALGAFGASLYLQPAAYVGIDMNPSLELSVNTFGTVIDAQALNEDASSVLKTVSLQNKSYEEALDELLASEALAAYASSDPSIEVSVTANDPSLAQRLESESETCLSRHAYKGSCCQVNMEERQAAHDCGMGVGKYRAAQQLVSLDESISLEECRHMSMREIRDRIEEHAATSDRLAEDRSESGYGSGHGKGSSEGAGANGQKSQGEDDRNASRHHGRNHGLSESS